MYYTSNYDVFLSYRRDGGEAMAILIRDRLVAKGFRVFLDIESLNSGSFNTKLFSVIEGCKDVVVVCSQGSLERCNNEGDWVRAEIAHALKLGKNVVPVMLRGFEWPAVLPEDMEALRMQNGVNANSNEYFDAAVDRLAEKFLMSTPQAAVKPEKPKSNAKWVYASAAGLVVIIGLIVTLMIIFSEEAPPPPAPRDRSQSRQEEPSAPAITTEANEPVEPSIPAEPEAPAEPAVTDTSDPFEFTDFVIIGGERYSKDITELIIISERLTDEDILPLRHLTNLTYLDLDGNNITDISLLAGLTKLEHLDLQGNRIRDISPLAGLINLEYLTLWDNVITDISPLEGLTKLETLDLDNNIIRDISALSGLVNLEYLYLWDNLIEDISPLAGLTNLRTLDLDENNISDLTPLFGLRNLRTLWIAENPLLTEAQIAALENALPDCNIYYYWEWDDDDYDWD
jgi:hypothetical protein